MLEWCTATFGSVTSCVYAHAHLFERLKTRLIDNSTG